MSIVAKGLHLCKRSAGLVNLECNRVGLDLLVGVGIIGAGCNRYTHELARKG
jgi:hypothetical protein